MKRALLAALLAAAAAACGPGRDPGLPPEPPDPEPPSTGADAGVDARVEPPAPAPRPVVLVDEPAALAAIEAGGGGFTALVAEADELAVEAVLSADVAEARRADPLAGVGVRRFVHRLFDVRWLNPRGGYQLIALATRFDRIPVSGGPCGELRLIYRLAYTAVMSGQPVSSRLPMTIMVVLRGDEGVSGCTAAARRWLAPPDLAGDALGRWLVAGPLQGALVAARVIRIETDVQQVRWPSTIRPDLGGHAEYVLRSFRRDGRGRMAAAPVENTPDVSRLLRDHRLRAELIDWVGAERAAIDAGTVLLPARFQATRALSVTPRGFSRRANRPFRQLLAPADLAGIDLTGLARAGSPEAMLRRLDDLTCQGCHQSRTIAGFHALGVDGDDAVAGNALAIARSVHLIAEEDRRAGIVAALAAGRAPDYARPFAARAPADPGLAGAPCGLGDPGFAAWTCAAGLACAPYDAPDDDRAVGTCLPAQPGIGDPCEVAPLVAAAHPHRDRAPNAKRTACGAGAVCDGNRVGFPGGMCAASCAGLPAGATCGAIALLTPFNDCLARKVPFPTCLAEHVTPAGLRACDAAHPCREDYICARTASGAGACTPPYFLFQLRVDGHP